MIKSGHPSTNETQVAAAIAEQVSALEVLNTPNVRKIRQRYSRQLANADPEVMVALAQQLIHGYGHRALAYELLAHHPKAFQSLNATKLEALGRGINSWSSVDSFARTLAGPAWLHGLVRDETIHRWAHSPDRWWRRAALASTVALNTRTQGGYGDTDRTLAICRLLAADGDDMVYKALSWALRALVVHDPAAVEAFIEEHRGQLHARVVREVRNKLATGLKNPPGGLQSHRR